MANLPERVALVYDRVNKWGGAEQVLLILHEIFPSAPLFTSVYYPAGSPWVKVFPRVIPSFLQSVPLAKNHHEYFFGLTPLAFESLRFDEFDLVISVTSSDAKGIITKPRTLHVCYCLTPTRYLWITPPPVLESNLKWLFNYLKSWDLIAASRPDAYISISNTVKNRLMKYYSKNSVVIYPPINFSLDSHPKNSGLKKDYFLFVGRLVYHKEPDLLVRVFNDLGLKLVVAGTGKMLPELKFLARSNITFLGQVSDSALKDLYLSAKALVTVHEEDFGLTYLEALMAKLPVVALNKGGVAEIVEHGSTGYLAQSLDELKQALTGFDALKFNFNKPFPTKFTSPYFKKAFVREISKQWTKHKLML